MSQINRFTPVSGPGSGTVTSISAGTGITLTPNPITTTGTVALTVPVSIANGGTNATSFTNTDGVVYFDGTRLVDTAVGTLGYVLTSNGAGMAPTFQAIAADGAVTTLHTQDGNNVTPTAGVINISGGNSLTTTGTAGPNTATISLTGITQYNVQTGGAANALNNVAPGATSGVPLISQGAASQPIFGTAVVAGGGTGAVSFTAHGVILGEGTSPLGVTAAGTTGQVLTGVTGSDPVWASPASSSISITGDSGGALVGAAFTFTGGTTGLTFAGAGSTETLGGTLVVSNGGTGRATLTNHGLLVGAGTAAITQLANATNGQLPIGSTGADPVLATITAGANVTVTNGAGTITIAANATSATFNYVSVNHAASPYTALSTDYYISADVTAGVITILLPNAPVTGRVFVVKDKVGLAAASNITVTTVGGAVTIDGATSFVMDTAYQAASLIFNGVSYEIY